MGNNWLHSDKGFCINLDLYQRLETVPDSKFEGWHVIAIPLPGNGVDEIVVKSGNKGQCNEFIEEFCRVDTTPPAGLEQAAIEIIHNYLTKEENMDKMKKAIPGIKTTVKKVWDERKSNKE